MEGFHPEGIVFMIQQGNGLADQGDGGFIEFSVEGDRPVPVHFPDGMEAEVIPQILWRFSDQMGVFEIPGKGRLLCAGVNRGMVLLVDPSPEGLIEFFERKPRRTGGQKLRAQGAEEAFDFSLSLRLIRGGMNQGNAQSGGGMTQQMGTEGGPIVDVELPGVASPILWT